MKSNSIVTNSHKVSDSEQNRPKGVLISSRANVHKKNSDKMSDSEKKRMINRNMLNYPSEMEL